jgi:hypothetical protein
MGSLRSMKRQTIEPQKQEIKKKTDRGVEDRCTVTVTNIGPGYYIVSTINSSNGYTVTYSNNSTSTNYAYYAYNSNTECWSEVII